MASNIPLNWTETIYSSDIGPPPIIVNPNDSYVLSQTYTAYGCFVGVLIVVFIALIIKIALNRKRFQTRNVALRQTIAPQNQLSTVSRSVNANSGDRRDSDVTIKIDLPPTYEEVMTNVAHESERAATSNTLTGGDGSVETRDTHGMVEDEVHIISTSDQRSVV